MQQVGVKCGEVFECGEVDSSPAGSKVGCGDVCGASDCLLLSRQIVHRYAINKEEHISNQGIYLGGLGLVCAQSLTF